MPDHTSIRTLAKLLPPNLYVDGCDTPDWLPFLTADELELDRPKLTIDYATGLEYISVPTTEDGGRCVR